MPKVLHQNGVQLLGHLLVGVADLAVLRLQLGRQLAEALGQSLMRLAALLVGRLLGEGLHGGLAVRPVLHHLLVGLGDRGFERLGRVGLRQGGLVHDVGHLLRALAVEGDQLQPALGDGVELLVLLRAVGVHVALQVQVLLGRLVPAGQLLDHSVHGRQGQDAPPAAAARPGHGVGQLPAKPAFHLGIARRVLRQAGDGVPLPVHRGGARRLGLAADRGQRHGAQLRRRDLPELHAEGAEQEVLDGADHVVHPAANGRRRALVLLDGVGAELLDRQHVAHRQVALGGLDAGTGGVEELARAAVRLLELLVQLLQADHELRPAARPDQRPGAGVEHLVQQDGQGILRRDVGGDHMDAAVVVGLGLHARHARARHGAGVGMHDQPAGIHQLLQLRAQRAAGEHIANALGARRRRQAHQLVAQVRATVVPIIHGRIVRLHHDRANVVEHGVVVVGDPTVRGLAQRDHGGDRLAIHADAATEVVVGDAVSLAAAQVRRAFHDAIQHRNGLHLRRVVAVRPALGDAGPVEVDGAELLVLHGDAALCQQVVEDTGASVRHRHAGDFRRRAQVDSVGADQLVHAVRLDAEALAVHHGIHAGTIVQRALELVGDRGLDIRLLRRRLLLLRLQLAEHVVMAGLGLGQLVALRPVGGLLLQFRDVSLGAGLALLDLLDGAAQVLDGVGHAHGQAERIGVEFKGGGIGAIAHDLRLVALLGDALQANCEVAVAADLGLLGSIRLHLGGLGQDRLAGVLALVELLAVDGDDELLGQLALCIGAQLVQQAVSALDAALRRADAVAQAELLALVVHPLVFELPDLLAQAHLFEDQRVAAGGRLHLGGVRGLAGNVLDLAGAGRALAHLLDEVGLALDGLPHAAVQGLLRGVAEDRHLEALGVALVQLVALADDPPLALLKIGRAPRRVHVVQGDQPVLHVGAGAHLRGGAEQEAHAAGADLAEKLLLLEVGLGVVDEGDLVGRDALGDQLLLQVVIDREVTVQGHQLVGADLIQLGGRVLVSLVGPACEVAQALGLGGTSVLRRGQVDEDQLRAAILVELVVERAHVAGGDVDLAALVIRVARVDQAHIQGGLPGVAHDLQHVVRTLLRLLRQVLGAPNQRAARVIVGVVAVRVLDRLADVVGLVLAARDDDVLRLAAAHLRHRQLLALGGEHAVDVRAVHHVGEGAVALHQLRHVHEFREPAVHLVLAGRRQLPVGHDLAEHARPGVEVAQALALQVHIVEIPLHGVHLGHGVADRRAGGEDHVAAAGGLQHLPDLQEQVGRLLAAGLRAQACDAVHGGGEREVLELVRLVHEQGVHAQLAPVQAVVLVVGVDQLLQLLLQGVAALLRLLDVPAVLAVHLTHQLDGGVEVIDLLLNECGLLVRLHLDLAETCVRDDHRVPVAGGDPGEQALAVLLLEVLLGRREHVGARVELGEVGRPLADEVVRHHEHGLLGEAHAAQLHRAGDHGEGLAGADDVVQQGRVSLHDPPHGVPLVRAQGDDVVADLAGEREVRAVVVARDVGVVGVVVDAAQALAPGIVSPHPTIPGLLDRVHLVVGELGFALVQGAAAVRVRVVDL
ncbi:hypothetical protein [Pseudomonas phage Itty13]|uniref:Uncharacterized protein n=1 Tax=Pseudomonas phage Itty13 TaxID=2805750 RepID=A0A889IQH4_9CAUD|nr:hypothetical protein PQC19_gp01 [Pseudomonas phage Itty13]QRE00577.1 hypothetical protein [Pseudomonas phage Itty13]